jgi:hypothetical protein
MDSDCGEAVIIERTLSTVLGVLGIIFIPYPSTIIIDLSVITAAGTRDLSKFGIYLPLQAPTGPTPGMSTGAPSAIVIFSTASSIAPLK